jgi:hypothetical protein
MANQALAVLESALRDRKLDRTLTTALPSFDRTDATAVPGASVPFGIDALDDRLRGGLPRGQVSELAGAPASASTSAFARASAFAETPVDTHKPLDTAASGRMTLLLQLMADATRRGEVVALVDTCDRLDVASAAAAGVCLERLLWIRGGIVSSGIVSSGVVSGASRTTGAAGATWERTLDRAIKALNLVLRAGGFAVVAIDLADVPAVWLKRLPFTTWLRVQRSIEGSDTACVLVTPEPLARSAGGLTLMLAGRTTWTTGHRRLTGLETQVRIVSPRRRVEGEVEVRASAGDSH